MTNYGTLAILALPGIPERQLRFLLALETVTAREDGWREVETGMLAGQAHRSVRTACKARGELVRDRLIEYRPGTGPGHPGRYRVLFEVGKPPKNAARVKPGNDAARVKPGNDAARVNPGKRAPVSLANALGKPTPPNAVTSANASISLEPLTLESSALREAPRLDGHAEGAPDAAPGPASQGRAARLPNGLLPGQPPDRPGTGQCPACRRWVGLAGFGQIKPHPDFAASQPGQPCPGEGQPPVMPVPCLRCGRIGQRLWSESGLCKDCRAVARAGGTP